MRRFNLLANLWPAAASGAAPATVQQARAKPTLFITSSSSQRFVQKIADRFGKSGPSFAGAVAGFHAAATSLAQDAHPKERSRSLKFLQKDEDVVLYHCEFAPITNIVKAFLDYNKIRYKLVDLCDPNKGEFKWSDKGKLLILKVDGELVYSSDIIDKLFQRIHPDNSASKLDEEMMWLSWVDNYLAYLLIPNMGRSISDALEAFDYITTLDRNSFGFFPFNLIRRLATKHAGAAALYSGSKILKKKHNIAEERASLYEAAETWVDALNGREYLGGSKPNLADLAAFGVLRPMRRLKAGKDMMEHTRIGEWYTRMESTVGESSRIN